LWVSHLWLVTHHVRLPKMPNHYMLTMKIETAVLTEMLLGWTESFCVFEEMA
jgi:hypothetical protein